MTAPEFVLQFSRSELLHPVEGWTTPEGERQPKSKVLCGLQWKASPPNRLCLPDKGDLVDPEAWEKYPEKRCERCVRLIKYGTTYPEGRK